MSKRKSCLFVGAAVTLIKAKPAATMCVVADPDLLWGLIQKMLNANMPEEFYAWLSNFKKTLEPLLERALDLLHAAP